LQELDDDILTAEGGVDSWAEETRNAVKDWVTSAEAEAASNLVKKNN
jgi:hypothetical protein